MAQYREEVGEGVPARVPLLNILAGSSPTTHLQVPI